MKVNKTYHLFNLHGEWDLAGRVKWTHVRSASRQKYGSDIPWWRLGTKLNIFLFNPRERESA